MSTRKTPTLPGFKIIDAEDINAPLEKIHRNGWDAGVYVGFPQLDGHYSMLPGNTTDWTGYPQSGKTEFVLELLFFTSHAYGWTHLLYLPDVGQAVEIMMKLIHKHTGKTFVKRYPNYIAIEEVWRSVPWLLQHFKIIHRVDRKARLTPVQLWDFAANLKASGEALNTVTIDSWKDMRHDYGAHGGSYAQYLSDVLPERNDIAEQSGLHFHTIVHPKNPVRDKKRKIFPPFPDDMEGGAQWNSSGKCIIAVHREVWDTCITDIYFRKIKPESVGRASITPTSLMFEVETSRYYWLADHDRSRVYAAEKKATAHAKPLVLDFSEPAAKHDEEDEPF